MSPLPDRFRVFVGLSLVACAAATAQAEIKMPAIFGDHMVLQRGSNLPVWGWADPGEKVTVNFAGKTAVAVAEADGSWKASCRRFPPTPSHRS